jgi:glycerol kinase
MCLDQGGSRSRALLYDRQGQLLRQVEQAVASQQPAADRVEHQPQQLLDSLYRCSAQLIDQLTPAQRQRLSSWGLSCQRSSLICVDRQSLEPLTPVISWRDHRGAQQRLWNDDQRRWLRQRTGLRPSHHHGASKLCWLLQQQPAVAQAAAANRLLALPLASFLAAKLSKRRPKADPSNAQRTLLYNPREQHWDPQLLALFGLAEQILPPLQPCRSDWGELDLNGCQLEGGYVGGDQGCALFADGAPLTTELRVNLGTGGFVCLPLSPEQTQQLPDSLLLSLATNSPTRQQWMAEGTINGAAAALHWWADYERFDYRQLEQQYFQRPLAPAQGLFINAVSGLGSPYWRSDLESRFIDTPTPEQRYSAVVESILFLVRVQLDSLLEQQLTIDRIQLSGGLARINGLGQRLADLCQRPVRQTRQHQASGRGLAYLLADQPKDWPATPGQTHPPRADRLLQQRYRRWQSRLEQQLRTG